MSSISEVQLQYAQLLIRTALNLQSGQRLYIWAAPVEASEFMRILVDEAYRTGARDVDIFWEDDRLRFLRMEHQDDEIGRPSADWAAAHLAEEAAKGEAFLVFDCTCAGLFDSLRLERIVRSLIAENQRFDPVWEHLARNTTNWSIAAVPTENWARKLYPELPVSKGIRRIWEDIATYCRLGEKETAIGWTTHIAHLQARSEWLNGRDFRGLCFRGPGTDLYVGLPRGHVWRGPGFISERGVRFIPNLPMEEVFTLPHLGSAEGKVRGTLPLVVNGGIVEGFSLIFQQGRAVSASAKRGEVLLKEVLETDEGSCRLGEVALVPQSSPLAREGRLFYNTLFDENASCHLALGRAYRFSLRNGGRLSVYDFAAAGGNQSHIHVDFMIGSNRLDIDGLTSGNGEEAIMKSGEWVAPEATPDHEPFKSGS